MGQQDVVNDKVDSVDAREVIAADGAGREAGELELEAKGRDRESMKEKRIELGTPGSDPNVGPITLVA